MKKEKEEKARRMNARNRFTFVLPGSKKPGRKKNSEKNSSKNFLTDEHRS